MAALPSSTDVVVQSKTLKGTAPPSVAAMHRAVSISAKAVDAPDPEILESLIDGAREVARQCDELLTQCQARESSASKAAADLQERLQLGARMLKAFQTQIDQVQALFAEARNRQQQAQSAEAQLRQRVSEFEAYIEGAHKRFDDRLEQATMSAILRIEQAAMSRPEHRPSELAAAKDLPQPCCEDLVQLSTMLHEAAQRVAHLAEATAGAGTQSSQDQRADVPLEAKPKATSADPPAQPPLRLHA